MKEDLRLAAPSRQKQEDFFGQRSIGSWKKITYPSFRFGAPVVPRSTILTNFGVKARACYLFPFAVEQNDQPTMHFLPHDDTDLLLV